MKSKRFKKSNKGKLVKTSKYKKHEHISLNEFLENKAMVPGKKEKGSGVYALYNGNNLYYVGLSTTSIRGRLERHSSPKSSKYGKWNNFSFYYMPFKKRIKYIKDIETILIHIAKPPRSKQQGKF